MAHCEKDLLVLFGGEYFDGKSTEMFNEVILYNIKVLNSAFFHSFWLSVVFNLLQVEARILECFFKCHARKIRSNLFDCVLVGSGGSKSNCQKERLSYKARESTGLR